MYLPSVRQELQLEWVGGGCGAQMNCESQTQMGIVSFLLVAVQRHPTCDTGSLYIESQLDGGVSRG